MELVLRVFERVVATLEIPPELVTSDFAFDVSEVSPEEGGVVHGVEAAQKAVGPYWDTFDRMHTEIEEVIHSDGDRMVAVVRDTGRIKGSDAEITNRYFHVFTFREGKLAGQSVHSDVSRALEAAGLSE